MFFFMFLVKISSAECLWKTQPIGVVLGGSSLASFSRLDTAKSECLKWEGCKAITYNVYLKEYTLRDARNWHCCDKSIVSYKLDCAYPEIWDQDSFSFSHSPDSGVVRYYGEAYPKYLQKTWVENDIDSAFRAWNAEQHLISFKRTWNQSEAELRLTWTDLSSTEKKGLNVLAETKGRYILFDSSDKWATSDMKSIEASAFYIREVCTHEIGHFLGFEHASDGGIMEPFYRMGNIMIEEGNEEGHASYKL